MATAEKTKLHTLYVVTAPAHRDSVASNTMVWRVEINALNEGLARFEFTRQWAGIMCSHDLRPSDLEVEVAEVFYA